MNKNINDKIKELQNKIDIIDLSVYKENDIRDLENLKKQIYEMLIYGIKKETELIKIEKIFFGKLNEIKNKYKFIEEKIKNPDAVSPLASFPAWVIEGLEKGEKIKDTKELENAVENELSTTTEKLDLDFNTKLLDNPNNFNELKAYVKRNHYCLLKAPTGTGKTFAIVKLFKEFKFNDKDKNVNILIVPTRAQALQLKNEYADTNFNVIVGGSENVVSYLPGEEKIADKTFRFFDRYTKVNLEKSNNFVVVLDKIEVLESLFLEFPEYTYNLIIDEAHKLYNAYNYRDTAILKTRNFVENVREYKRNRIVFMTATTTVLDLFDNLDCKISFTSENKTAKFEDLEVVYNQENKPFLDKLYSLIKYENEAGNKVLCRLNSIQDINNAAALLKNDNLDVKTVTSKDKQFVEEKDENGNVIAVNYENEIFECFINNSSLPSADIWFSTSLIDEGSNIKNIEGLGEYNKLTCIFVVKDKRFLAMDDIVQFFARIRYPYKKAIVLVNNFIEVKIENSMLGLKYVSKNDEFDGIIEENGTLEYIKEESKDEYILNKMKTIDYFKKKINEEADLTKQVLIPFVKLMEKKGVKQEVIRNEINDYFFKKEIKGADSKIGMDSFRITSSKFDNDNMEFICSFGAYNIYLDKYAIDFTVYTLWNRQFYNNTTALLALLKQKFNIKDVGLKEFNLKELDDTVYNNFFDKLVKDKNVRKEFYKHIKNNNLDEYDELTGILHTTNIKKLVELIRVRSFATPGYKQEEIVKDCINAVYKEKDGERVFNIKKLNDFREINISKILLSLPVEKIVGFLNTNVSKTDAEIYEILKNLKYIATLKEAYNYNKDKKEFATLIFNNGGSLKSWNNYIQKEEIKKLNNLYIKDKEKLAVCGLYGKEHFIILENTYILNESGNMKKIKIDEEKLEEITGILNKEFKKSTYTNLKVKNIIKKIYNCSKDLQLNYLYL